MRWKETENGMTPLPPCGANAAGTFQYGISEVNVDTRRRELLATVRTWLLLWSVTLLLMLEDDVAIIALMFC